MTARARIREYTRVDGALVIEGIGATVNGMEDIPNPPMITLDHDGGLYCRPPEEGDEGCLASTYYVGPTYWVDGEMRDPLPSAHLATHPEGIAGNSDPSIRRLHGWRGTWNDWATNARGWRKVLSYQPRKRGIGWRLVLSEDLKPEEK